MPEKQPFTAGQMLDLIRGKHAGQNWAVIPSVPNGTGGHKSRTADALAMSLWPSQGLHLHGFEIKVSRGDWLREIQDPLKADAFAAHCDFWWIAAPDGIVKLEEMPGSWGLMTPTKNRCGLTVKKGAERRASPEPIDRAFLAALCRAVQRELPGEKELTEAYDKGYRDCSAKWDASRDTERAAKRMENDYLLKNLTESVDAFEKASGIKINHWNGGKLGKLVAAVEESQMDQVSRELARFADWCQSNAERFRKAHERLQVAIGEEIE